MPNADVFLRHDDGRLEQVAIGESPWPSTTPGVDVSQIGEGEMKTQKAMRLPWFVKTGLRDIEADPAYQRPDRKLNIVCPAGKQEPVFGLPAVIDDDGVIANQLLIAGADGHSRRRCGCFVELISKDAQPKYLLILEGGTRPARSIVVPAKYADVKHAAEIAIAK